MQEQIKADIKQASQDAQQEHREHEQLKGLEFFKTIPGFVSDDLKQKAP